MLSPQSKQVREFVESQYTGFSGDLTIQQMREGLDAGTGNIPPLEGLKTEEVMVGNIPAEWVRMPNVATDRVLLYLHGGAYTMGSRTSHRDLAARLSQASGVQVLLLDYRLAPENPYPAAIEDATAAYRWLLDQGFKPEHIAIGGDSAGGGLTLVTTISLRDGGFPLPAALILLSPWTDLTSSGESMTTRASADPVIRHSEIQVHVKHYVGEGDASHHLVSPVFADLKGLPPTLIHVGRDEVLLDDSTRVAKKINDAGGHAEIKVWDDMWHVFQAYAVMLSEGQESINELGQFVKSRLSAD